MDSLNSDNSKVVGHGEAKVIEVRRSGGNGHEVRVYHPDIGFSDFIPYIQTAGMYRKPMLGDQCFIFFNENFKQYPMAWGHRLSKALIAQLVGSREDNITIIYSAGESYEEVRHRVELDDGENDRIRIVTAGNNEIEIKNEESITLKHFSGPNVKITADEISLTIGKTSVIMNETGITLTAGNGSKIDLAEAVQASSADGSTLEMSDSVSLNASQGSSVTLDSSTTIESSDQLGKFDDVIVKTHRHYGNIGIPTSAPIP